MPVFLILDDVIISCQKLSKSGKQKNILKPKNVIYMFIKNYWENAREHIVTPLFFLNEKSCSLEDQVFIFLLKIKEGFPHWIKEASGFRRPC